MTAITGVYNTFTLTWRSVLKIRTNMEELLGLLLQPIMYLLLFTYVFGGALAGGTHGYLQYVLPGILVMSGHGAQHRHQHRRLRQVPQPADRPLGATGWRGARRHDQVHDVGGDHARVRHDHGVPHHG
jgi:hypothetical protein